MKKGVDFTAISVSFFCHDGHGHFVLNKRSKNARDEHGCWDGGGGSLEFGDTAEATLRREIQEEYCADIQAFEFIGYRDIFRTQNGTKTHWLSLDFLVQLDRNQVKIGEPEKFDDLQWFTLETLPSPVHSQLPVFLAKYAKLLTKVLGRR